MVQIILTCFLCTVLATGCGERLWPRRLPATELERHQLKPLPSGGGVGIVLPECHSTEEPAFLQAEDHTEALQHERRGSNGRGRAGYCRVQVQARDSQVPDGATQGPAGDTQVSAADGPTPAGVAVYVPARGVLQLPAGGVLQLPAGGVLQLPAGGVLQLSAGDVLQLPAGDVLQLPAGGTKAPAEVTRFAATRILPPAAI